MQKAGWKRSLSAVRWRVSEALASFPPVFHVPWRCGGVLIRRACEGMRAGLPLFLLPELLGHKKLGHYTRLCADKPVYRLTDDR